MPLFFGSFTKALLGVFEFPVSDDLAYKLDLPNTGEADELSLILLSSGLNGEYIYDIAGGLDETQLSKYRSGKRQVHSEIVDRYKDSDVRKIVSPFFIENITPNIPLERRYDLIQSLLDLIEGDSRISDRQKHEFRRKALDGSLNDFLVEVFIYAVKSPLPSRAPDEPSSKQGYRCGKHRVYNCPYDPAEIYMEQEALNALRQNFADGKHIVAICGEEGIGKTELALRYACEVALDIRKTVVWIDAADEETIFKSLRQFLLEKNLNKNATSKDLVADSIVKDEFLTWADINNDWLMVFDNIGTANNEEQIYSQYMPQGGRGDILLTATGDCLPEAASVVLAFQDDKTPAFEYLRRRYGDRYPVSPFRPNPPFTFRNIPFVLEMMSGYALSTGDFEMNILMDSGLGFFEPNSYEDSELGMVIPVRSYDYKEKQLASLSCEELVQRAFRVLWSHIDAPYRFLLSLMAQMPHGELNAGKLEEICYGEGNYDYYRKAIPANVWSYLLNVDELTNVLHQLVSLGICKAAYYAIDDPRWDNHFGGLKKVRIHRLLRRYINMDTQPDSLLLCEKLLSL